MFDIIRSMYSKVKSKIFLNGEKSETFDCHLGVRQGECLSPFLFAMYINDLENVLMDNQNGVDIGYLKILMLFYADDLVLFNETPDGLQKEIDSLHTYCNK